MKIGIMQPYFFPYLGYFQAIQAVDKYILYSDLTFIKDGWMNRNRILIKNGTISTISVPLIQKSSNVLIKNVRIDNSKKWNIKLLKTIYLNYKGSRFFDDIYILFEQLLYKHYDYLYELNAQSIIEIVRYLDISTQIQFNTNDRYSSLESQLLKIDCKDYSNFPYMEKTMPIKKVARVLAISKEEDADTFINAIGGQALYDKKEFAQYGLDLKFIHTDEFEYSQFMNEFVPNLSIIDVMMHNGKEKTLELIKKYSFV